MHFFFGQPDLVRLDKLHAASLNLRGWLPHKMKWIPDALPAHVFYLPAPAAATAKASNSHSHGRGHGHSHRIF